MVPVKTIGFVLICAGVVWLQIFLSKRENRWFGLFLPFICLALALLTIFSMIIPDGMSAWEAFAMAASAFLMANIPTAILLIIYFACREKTKHKRELDKMNAQDLD